MSKKPPAYRLHKATGQAYIRVGDAFLYLGRWGTTESHMRYEQTIAEWRATGGLVVRHKKEEVTVAEVVAAYLERASRFNYADDSLIRINRAMEGMLLFSDQLAMKFGPLKLQAVRECWIADKLSRGYVNALTAYCKAAFRHAVSMELCDPSVAAALDSVENLKRGRCKAREPEERKPVSWNVVEDTLAKLTPVTRAMIQMMWLTGARGGEIRIMRPMDINRDEDVWVYTPETHKTELYGHDRTIFIGPQGQDILRPWLIRPADRYCFCPNESRRYKELAAKPLESILVMPDGEKPFQRQSFIRAVGRAAKAAGHNAWTPHQLRHAAAARFSTVHGEEVAQRLLGHAKLDMTAHYAKAERERAIIAARASC